MGIFWSACLHQVVDLDFCKYQPSIRQGSSTLSNIKHANLAAFPSVAESAPDARQWPGPMGWEELSR